MPDSADDCEGTPGWLPITVQQVDRPATHCDLLLCEVPCTVAEKQVDFLAEYTERCVRRVHTGADEPECAMWLAGRWKHSQEVTNIRAIYPDCNMPTVQQSFTVRTGHSTVRVASRALQRSRPGPGPQLKTPGRKPYHDGDARLKDWPATRLCGH
jgi:hypothetical protein